MKTSKAKTSKVKTSLMILNKKRKTTEIEKPASHLQTWHTFLAGQEDEKKKVIKNGGYECSFLWYGANKYMHFVPFANGCAPPVLDKRGNKVWSHFMVIYLQARKTPLNTLLINFLSKIRKGTWMSKKLIFWNEMNLSGWIRPVGVKAWGRCEDLARFPLG